jgi:hypothetical protein
MKDIVGRGPGFLLLSLYLAPNPTPLAGITTTSLPLSSSFFSLCSRGIACLYGRRGADSKKLWISFKIFSFPKVFVGFHFRAKRTICAEKIVWDWADVQGGTDLHKLHIIRRMDEVKDDV